MAGKVADLAPGGYRHGPQGHALERAALASAAHGQSRVGQAPIVIVMVLGWLGMRWMISPLLHLSRIAEQLADGDIECTIVDIRSHDEIGTLSRAFRKLIIYFQEMAH